MFKTVLVSLMTLLASSNAAPYVYGSPYYASYPFGAPTLASAAYPAPALASAAYTAPGLAATAYTAPALASAAYTSPTLAAAPVAEATLPAAAYPPSYPYPLSGLSGYAYGSSYSVQELAPLVTPPSAPLVVGSPYAYATSDYIYGR